MPEASASTDAVATQTPNIDPSQVGTVIGNVPFGVLIGSMANAIAEAQANLDRN